MRDEHGLRSQREPNRAIEGRQHNGLQLNTAKSETRGTLSWSPAPSTPTSCGPMCTWTKATLKSRHSLEERASRLRSSGSYQAVGAKRGRRESSDSEPAAARALVQS